MADLIDRQAAIDALWEALYEYEDKTEKQFQESEGLDIGDWVGHRIFVQNMNDIDRQTIFNLPSAQPEQKKGKWIWNENGMDWGLGAWCCSECRRKPETWWESDKRYNPLRCAGGRFCGTCGADMRGGE